MLGFERRQYEVVIDRELDQIQTDVERGQDVPALPTSHRRR